MQLELKNGAMKTLLIPIAAAAGICLFAACTKDDVLAPGRTSAEGAALSPKVGCVDALNAILDSRFMLERLNGYPVYLAPGVNRPWLKLKDGHVGELVGFTGCNQLIGTFNIGCSDLHLMNIATTKIFCPDADVLEDQFLAALGEIDSYVLDGSKLILVRGHTPLATLRANQFASAPEQRLADPSYPDAMTTSASPE